ncbi:hypothetical protein M408DRAFT_333109 [Serendipita vermifera MAFF 305830]|uniref:Uncharacterized protein n=1 Tax=Serendipita vermifera MAFF 305830 TaxID=933852 RepID=A0A0C3A6E3_SERVB|nr:hypothetical protein M408DRAFT_334078 [Serendipita vermifera MAFF 305830]KIM21979.1 hypothetical protein M408DRAFT_333109 [Serendipita vermifera MAFF 305830]
MADLGSQLLGVRTPRKSPNSGLSSRRSNVSLRQSTSLAQDLGGGGENDGGQRFTLAHELAAALMPDPSSSSRMLADEFGIELDDDEGEQEEDVAPDTTADTIQPIEEDPSFAVPAARRERSPPKASAASSRRLSSVADDRPDSRTFKRNSPSPVFEQDPFLVLNQSLKSTDLFITQLKNMDGGDTTAQASSTMRAQDQLLETLAADIIRKIDETAREREEQVRELLGYEREFRKISEEIGGNDLLGDLEELDYIEGLVDETYNTNEQGPGDEEQLSVPMGGRPLSTAWEDEPDPHNLNALMEEDEEEEENEYGFDEPTTPAKDAQFLPPSPPSTGPSTPSSTLPHLAYMRTITQSLVSSLGAISEQAQINAVATTEASRKIRALKNKLGEWRSEFDGAERSRRRIEKWEVGIWDDGTEMEVPSGPLSPTIGSPDASLPPGKPIDVRKIVEEELLAFSKVLQEVDAKTKAIMGTA